MPFYLSSVYSSLLSCLYVYLSVCRLCVNLFVAASVCYHLSASITWLVKDCSLCAPSFCICQFVFMTVSRLYDFVFLCVCLLSMAVPAYLSVSHFLALCVCVCCLPVPVF